MWSYIAKRLLLLIPTMLVLSVVAFFVIELPPGDYATTYISKLEQQGTTVSEEVKDSIREQFGLNKSPVERYFMWMGQMLRGNFGVSLYLRKPVMEVLLPRMGVTIGISLASLIMSMAIAIPIGVYSAVKQNTLGDHFFTLLGYVGLSIPTFILGLVMLYINAKYLGGSVGGLFSKEFQDAPWSMAKFVDFLQHVWIPVVIVAVQGTANTIRTVRVNLLDELKKPYVDVARAKGLSESQLIRKYPLRIALNPVISNSAFILPSLISGEMILSIVLNLPTVGPVFLESLKVQDMYLAGAFIMLTGFLAILGTLISDILLAVFDPRIRYR